MPESARIIIKGVTRAGRIFRPGDWAQRLTTAIASVGPDRRVIFHPRVHMATLEGVHCVVVEAGLSQEDPRLFQFLVNFARNNDLQMEEGAVSVTPPPPPASS